MLRKLIVNVLALTVFLLFTSLSVPALLHAQDSTQTCTQVTQYGGSVGYICGAATHVPVNTGWGDVSLPVLISGLFLVSSGLYLLSRKIDLKYKGGEQ